MKPIKVLILDGVKDQSGEAFSSKAYVEYPQSIVISKDFSNNSVDILGKASLYRQGNEFFIEDIVWYDDTNKYLIEKHAWLYPCVGGKKIEKKEGKITHFTIDKIGLTLTPNTDERIKSVKAQIEEELKYEFHADGVKEV